jgi:hypothetical protein
LLEMEASRLAKLPGVFSDSDWPGSGMETG